MKLTMNQTVKYNGKYCAPGEVVDCKKEVAAGLIKSGAATAYAEPVDQTAEAEEGTEAGN